MEKPKRRSGYNKNREEPAAQNWCFSLRQNCEPLEKKITGRQSVACAGGQRDHHFVNEPGDGEGRKRSGDHACSTGHWSENQTEREIVKRAIPPASPEFRDGR